MSVLSDIIGSVRSRIMGNLDITSRIALWNNEPSVHTRLPLPSEVIFPLIAIGPTVVGINDVSLNSTRILVVSNIYCYGAIPDDFRSVEEVGYLLRTLFHRNYKTIVIPGYSVIGLVAYGPNLAVADDINICGKLVSLSIRLLKT